MKRAVWPIVVFPLLMAAGPAPPPPCDPVSATVRQMPLPTDLSGGQRPGQGLLGETSSLAAIAGARSGCGGTGPAAAPPPQAIADPRRDVLHGLPSPDVTRVIPGPAGN